ncbi:hypothetical protein [Moorena producens]|uniref:hypothetical protein n=1 Tax=Moorena producens TaxID=1155739 RepID=UPI003C781304
MRSKTKQNRQTLSLCSLFPIPYSLLPTPYSLLPCCHNQLSHLATLPQIHN